MNMSRTAHVIVLLVVLTAAFAGGVLATGREISPMAPGNVTSGTEHSELAQCLSQLREEIELLRKDLDGREQASSTSESRRPIEVPAADSQALDRLVRRSMSCSQARAGRHDEPDRSRLRSALGCGSRPPVGRARGPSQASTDRTPSRSLPAHSAADRRTLRRPGLNFLLHRRRAELRVPAQRVRAPARVHIRGRRAGSLDGGVTLLRGSRACPRDSLRSPARRRNARAGGGWRRTARRTRSARRTGGASRRNRRGARHLPSPRRSARRLRN